MSAPHDSEVQINTYDTNAFLIYIGENYDLSEVKMTKNIGNGYVIINYNADKCTTLLDNIRHAAMAWNAAINR